MKIQRRKIEREANEGSQALQWIAKNAGQIEERANADGYGGFGPGTNGRSPGVSDPTAAAALSKQRATRENRQLELAAQQFADSLYEARMAALRAERIGRSLLALDPKEARKLARETPDARTICANPACRADILNLPNDRPREGRCEACYRYRKEHHGNERPRELAQAVDRA